MNGELRAAATSGETRMVAPTDVPIGSVMAEIKTDPATAYIVGIEMLAENSTPWNGLRCAIRDDGVGTLELMMDDNNGLHDTQPVGALTDPFWLIMTVVPNAIPTETTARCQLRDANGVVRTSTTTIRADAIGGLGTKVGLYARDIDVVYRWVEVTKRDPGTPTPLDCL